MLSAKNYTLNLAANGMLLANDLAQHLSNVGLSLADATRYATHCKWFNGQSTAPAVAPQAAVEPPPVPKTLPVSEATTNVPPGTWYRPVPSTSSFYNPTPSSTAFAEGRRDRLAFEQWINSLTEPGHGNMFDGAQYWAHVRSDSYPSPCSALSDVLGTSASHLNGGSSWLDGCNAAKEKLSPFDARRKNQPDYREGWNAASAELEVAPAPSLAVTTVPMQRDGGSYKLAGQINQTVTVDFVLDTGADSIVIPSKTLAELQKVGQVVERRGTQKWRDANGGVHEGIVVRLRELKIAGHVLRDLNVQVTDNDDGLLGQEFLRHFASYKIDNQRDVLVLEPLSSS
jgi:clan AA aspartic protease (TIGR02281 family)